MPDRLRAFLDRPLDVRIARAVVVVASAVFIGFASVALVGLGTGVDSREFSTSGHVEATPAPTVARAEAGANAKARPAVPRQDPQDRPGTAAARAARDELRSSRALQDVPYRRGAFSVRLVGARGDRAVLKVRARSLAAAREGWRRFLHRHRDSGRAYVPLFEAAGMARG